MNVDELDFVWLTVSILCCPPDLERQWHACSILMYNVSCDGDSHCCDTPSEKISLDPIIRRVTDWPRWAINKVVDLLKAGIDASSAFTTIRDLLGFSQREATESTGSIANAASGLEQLSDRRDSHDNLRVSWRNGVTLNDVEHDESCPPKRICRQSNRKNTNSGKLSMEFMKCGLANTY